jgi:hypothetical protein
VPNLGISALIAHQGRTAHKGLSGPIAQFDPEERKVQLVHKAPTGAKVDRVDEIGLNFSKVAHFAFFASRTQMHEPDVVIGAEHLGHLQPMMVISFSSGGRGA